MQACQVVRQGTPPFSHPDAAKARQEMVLTRMYELGMINEMRKTAVETPLEYLDK